MVSAPTSTGSSYDPQRDPALATASPPLRIHSVVFSGYEIQTFFPSPYPLEGPSHSSHPPPPSKSAKSFSPELVVGLDVAPSAPPPPLGERERKVDKKSLRGTSIKMPLPPPSASSTDVGPDGVQRLFVCDGCFKYMVHPAALTAHMKTCGFKSPPGRKVYQRGAHIIWEIDGALEKLYCQNLCLFSKLFIEHKYMFFDVEGFMFYVLTDATPSKDYVLGYFSKEKVSYDDNNLACIVTYPPYQKKGYGTLLIEFSYELDRHLSPNAPGSPERPLSPQGQRGYTAYWTSTLVRHLRAFFTPPAPPSPGYSEDGKKRVRRARGWDGELPAAVVVHPGDPPGVVGSEQGGKDEERLDIEGLAGTVHIRKEDVVFALVESGLAQWRRKTIGEEGTEREELVITKDLVEEVARNKGVKERAVLDRSFVLL